MITSPEFLGWITLGTIVFGIIAVLRKNVRWLPRGITGTATVARLQSGLAGILPKSTLGRTLVFGGIASLFIFWMFGTLPAPTEWKGSWKTPSLRAFTEFAWANWLPIVIFWGILSGAVAIAVNTCAIEKGTASTLYKVFGWVMGIVFLALPPLLWLVEPGSGSTAHKAATVGTKPVLTMSANGDSERINPPPGYRTAITGTGFATHCVYTDGSEGIIGDAKRPCKDGPILYQYVHNKKNEQNSVTYEFVRP